MTPKLLLASFEREEDVLEAVRASRERGCTIVDVYTPFPVHGLGEAMGLPPSRLPLVCLVSGVAGASAMAALAFWSTAVTWPLNVGGKPWNSLPAFMPPIFESMILCAALGTATAFAVTCRLRPGREPRPFVADSTDRRFVLAIEADDRASDAAAARRLFADCHVVQVEERIRELG